MAQSDRATNVKGLPFAEQPLRWVPAGMVPALVPPGKFTGNDAAVHVTLFPDESI
jgi:hypothetical protein